MKYITPVPPRNAQGLVRGVYRQIKRDFGAIVDPFAVHSILPRLMAAVWAACRESELVGVVPRETKEAIAVAISKRNETPFCVDAHVVMMCALKEHRIARAICDGNAQGIPAEMQVLLDWATATKCSNGAPPQLTRAAACEVISTVVFFQYINRIATVLLDDSPLPVSQRWLKPAVSRVAGWYFSFAARRAKIPGASLQFLPDAELSEDMAWAAANASVAGAWARFAQEVERYGHAALSDETRRFASDYIQQCEVDGAGSGRPAIEAALSDLEPAQRSSARLVLLTAMAPREVNEQIVRDFADPRDQEKLLGALAWASFTAARQHGARIGLANAVA